MPTSHFYYVQIQRDDDLSKLWSKKKVFFNFRYDAITKNVGIEHAKYILVSWLEVGQKEIDIL